MKKPLGQYGPAGVEDTTAAAPAAADDDDDDIDLFGSDEEEVNINPSQSSSRIVLTGHMMIFSPSFG